MHTKAYTVLGSRTKDHEETKHNYGLARRAGLNLRYLCHFVWVLRASISIQNAVCCPIKTSSILQKKNITTKSIDTGFLFVVT